MNVGAFNLGKALGAAVGGGVLSAGLGYAMVPIAGALLAVGGLLMGLATKTVRLAAAATG